MGSAKSDWMDSHERGWSMEEKFICEDCVGDTYLAQLVRENAASDFCDYCGADTEGTGSAALTEVVMPAIMAGIGYYFADPNEAGVPYESAEGGYLAKVVDTSDVLRSLSLECHDDFFEDLVNAIENDTWTSAAEGHWLGENPSETLTSAWSRFAHHVKHRQRYFFAFNNQGDEDLIYGGGAPSTLMPLIGEMVQALGLIQTMNERSSVYRARSRRIGKSWLPSEETMGPPHKEKAGAGRMNPAGITYFYGASEEATACAEVVGHPPCEILIARYRFPHPIRVLNLVNLPEPPSIFDYDNRPERENLVFLRRFVQQISKPIEKDRREHVDYAPSQVVSEFFASVFNSDGQLDGIVFPISIQPGGKNIVLFPREKWGEATFPQVEFEHIVVGRLMTWADVTRAIDSTRASILDRFDLAQLTSEDEN